MRQLLLAASLALLAACSGSEDTTTRADDGETATGFITENTAPPASARDIRGDGVMRDANERPFGYALLGERLPELPGPLAGGATPQDRQIDAWTIVYVWGMWCSDCMADAPYVEALYRAVEEDATLDFLSVHVPPSATRLDEAYGRFGSVEGYFESEGYSYPVIVDEDAALRETLRIAWTPTYLLVSPDRTIRAFRTDLSVLDGAPVKDFLADIAEVRARTPAPEASTSAPDGLAFTEAGIGGLTRPLPFTRTAIAAAFPEYRVDAGTGMVEGEAYPVFELRAQGADARSAPLVTLEPSWDRAIVQAAYTREPGIAGFDGSRIGQTRLSDLPDTVRASCEPGLEAYGEMLICTAPAPSGRMAWVFAAPEEYDGFLPDAPDAVIADARLVELRFRFAGSGEAR